MTTTTTWEKVERLPDGHRIFFAGDKIAIADNSGRTPELTDDGTLWMDFSRPLVVAGKFACIPIINEERGEFVTGTDFETVLMLSERYDWAIKIHGFEFIARRVDAQAA